MNWPRPLIDRAHILSHWMVLFIVLVSTAIVMIAAVGVQISQIPIQGYYKVGNIEATLITTSLLVMLAASVPVSNVLANRFGYKQIFLFANALLGISCFGVALSENFYLFLFFRGLNGIASGIIMPLSINLIAIHFPKQLQPLAFSLYTAFGFGIGYSIGALAGGFCSEYLNWQMQFHLAFFLSVFCVLGIVYLMHETEKVDSLHIDRLGLVSFFLFSMGIVFFCIHLKAPWNGAGIRSPLILFLIGLSIISFIVLIISQKKSDTPLFPPELFLLRPFVLGITALFFIGAIFFSTASLMSILFFYSYQWPFHQIALMLIPYGLSIGVFGSITGLISQYVGIRVLTFVGLFLVALSCFLNHSITIQSDHADFLYVFLIRGAGIGISLGPVTALSIRRVSQKNVGAASVIVTIFRQLGAAFGGLIMKIIIDIRYDFHVERFGEQLISNTEVYRQTLKKLDYFYAKTEGASSVIAQQKAKLTIATYIKNQASILATNDALLVFGVLLFVIGSILSYFMLRAFLQEQALRAANKNLSQ